MLFCLHLDMTVRGNIVSGLLANHNAADHHQNAQKFPGGWHGAMQQILHIAGHNGQDFASVVLSLVERARSNLVMRYELKTVSTLLPAEYRRWLIRTSPKIAVSVPDHVQHVADQS